MTVKTLYAVSSTVVSGVWSNASNASGSTAESYASWAETTASATGVLDLGFNFSADIPSDALINSVTVTVKNNQSDTVQMLASQFQLMDGANVISSLKTGTLSTSTATQDVFTAYPAIYQLRSANLKLRFTARRSTNVSPASVNIDFVKIDVDYALAPMTRIARKIPFTAAAPWNIPIGSGATYEINTDPKTASYLAGATGANINSNNGFGYPVSQATYNDPLATVSDGTRTFNNTRVPSAVEIATGSDKSMQVIAPDNETCTESWNTTKTSDTNYTSGYCKQNNLRTGAGFNWVGVRASGFSTMAGLIRTEEALAGRIQHTITVALKNSQLYKGPLGTDGYVWPAFSQDSNANTTYTGQVPMGTLLAIPASVDITTLGLTPEGIMLARCLQDYGAYVGDRSSAVAIYAEPSLQRDNVTLYNALSTAWTALWNQLRVVSNNSSVNVGGGGTLRQAALPAPITLALAKAVTEYSASDLEAEYYKQQSGLTAGTINDHKYYFYKNKLGGMSGTLNDLELAYFKKISGLPDTGYSREDHIKAAFETATTGVNNDNKKTYFAKFFS